MATLNRQQRRAAKRAAPRKKPEAHKLTAEQRRAAMERNGITQRDLSHAYEQGLNERTAQIVDYSYAFLYSACAITLHRRLEWGEDEIYDFLTAMQNTMMMSIDTEDIREICRRETGIDVVREGFTS